MSGTGPNGLNAPPHVMDSIPEELKKQERKKTAALVIIHKLQSRQNPVFPTISVIKVGLLKNH